MISSPSGLTSTPTSAPEDGSSWTRRRGSSTSPFDWDAAVAFFASGAVPGVESVSDGVYRRTISLDGAPGMLEIRPWRSRPPAVELAPALVDHYFLMHGAPVPDEVLTGIVDNVLLPLLRR